MEEPPVVGSELGFSESKPAGSEPSTPIMKPECYCEGADESEMLAAALDVVDKAWKAAENGHHIAEPARAVVDEKQVEAVASSEADADRSLSFTNGGCCERLEIVETSSPAEDMRVLETECRAEAQDVAAAPVPPNDNGMTAAPSDSAGEGTPGIVECGSPSLDNGTTDDAGFGGADDSAVPTDIISCGGDDACSPSTNDREPADLAVADEEVDVRGMQLSENDAAEPSATGECEWTRRVSWVYFFWLFFSEWLFISRGELVATARRVRAVWPARNSVGSRAVKRHGGCFFE